MEQFYLLLFFQKRFLQLISDVTVTVLSAQAHQTKSGSVTITDKNTNLFKHLLSHLKGYFNSHNGFFSK